MTYRNYTSLGLEFRVGSSALRVGVFGRGVLLPTFCEFVNCPSWHSTRWQVRVWRFAVAYGKEGLEARL